MVFFEKLPNPPNSLWRMSCHFEQWPKPLVVAVYRGFYHPNLLGIIRSGSLWSNQHVFMEGHLWVLNVVQLGTDVPNQQIDRIQMVIFPIVWWNGLCIYKGCGWEIQVFAWVMWKIVPMSGRAIFTNPSTAVNCGGAPQKIAYLAEAAWRKRGETVFGFFSSGNLGASLNARFIFCL